MNENSFEKSFFRLVGKQWYKAALSIVSGIVRSTLMLLPTWLTREIYNMISRGDFAADRILRIALLSFCIPIVVVILYLIDIRMNKYLFAAAKTLRVMALRNIFADRISQVVKQDKNRLFSVLIESLHQIADYYYFTLNTLTWYATTLAIGIVLMFLISPAITLRLLAFAVVQVALVTLLEKRMETIQAETNELHAAGTEQTNAILDFNAYIRVAGLRKNQQQRAQSWFAGCKKNLKRVLVTQQSAAVISAALTIGRTLYLFYVADGLLGQGVLLRGDFITLNSYILWLTPVMSGLEACIADIFIARANKKRVGSFLQQPAQRDVARTTPGEAAHTVQTKGLRFAYTEDHPIAYPDLEAHVGEVVLLRGESGCGKSTLLKMMIGLEEGYQGSLTINGVEVSRLDEGWLHKNVVLAGQADEVLPRTMRENLLYAGREADEASIRFYLRGLHLDYLVDRSADGLDQLLNENANGFSDGERKRLSVARALLAQPQVLLLDEPTAGLDNQNKQEVFHFIVQNFHGLLFVVTHDALVCENAKTVLFA